LERDPNRPSPKYINTPETRLFSKSSQLYGLDIVRDAITRDRRIVVVEGYTDVVMAHQCGVNNVVAVLGTALGERVIRLLQRYADTVTLVLDGDDAGKKRANEILELFVAAQLDLRILTLPDGLDPCDFLRHQGAEAFGQLLEQAVDALDHRLIVATENLDPVTQPDQAHRALEEILRTLAAAPRLNAGANESTRLREQQMLARLAREFHVDESTIRARLQELRSTAKRTPTAVQGTKSTSGKGLTPHESELFEIMALHPDLARRALAAIDAGALSSESARSVWELFERAARENVELEFEQVLTVAEDVSLKNLLVNLVDRAQDKAEHAAEAAEERLSGLIHDFEKRREELSQRAALAALEKRDYDEEEEVRILEKLIEQQRGRQGIPAPTDG
jgi:DNA primase